MYCALTLYSEDPDEMPHDVAFHQGLQCLQTQNCSSEKEIQYVFGNNNMRPLNIYNVPSLSNSYCILSVSSINCIVAC